jgi:hypothetical protein
MRAINDLHNDSGNGVTNCGRVQRVGNIGVAIY